MKFYCFTEAFLFLKKDKKLKKLAVALKFLYFFTLLSLKVLMLLLVFFACKDPFPLYKSSKGRNHLKADNLEPFCCQH